MVRIAFQLKADTPVRIAWRAQDGEPGNGYKAQITAIILQDGKRIPIATNEIVEACIPDPATAERAFNLSFAGVVGYDRGHSAHPIVAAIDEERVGYDLEFVRSDGTLAQEDEDFEIRERPLALAALMDRR